MKIGIFDPYLDDLGGGEKYMVTLAECLSKNNLVTIFWDRSDDLERVADRFSLDTSRIRLKSNIFSRNYSFLKRCLESLNYDVIVVLSDGSIPFVLSGKLLVHFQQPFPNVEMSFKNRLKKMRVSSFFCNSYFTKDFVDEEFGINSQVIYPPVSVEVKRTKKESIILHVGRFRAVNIESEDYKKQNIMIGVFKKMVDQGMRGWRFILAVGLNQKDKPQFNKMQSKAAGYPIDFLVNLNKDKLNEAYFKSKIYWHASGLGEDLIQYPDRAEHFGISTVEAMSAGAVPVVINAGGQKEIVENNTSGFLFDTIEDLKAKTMLLIGDAKLWQEMSKAAILRAKKFSGERFCKEISEMIK